MRTAKSGTTTLASPTVSHIADSIEDRIRRGVYKSGHWLPTERDLADEFKVSRMTIRSAVKEIERRSLVTCSARCRPLVRTPEGRNAATVALAPVSTNRRSLALWIWPNPTWPGSMMIVNGIRHSLDQDGFRLVLESAMGETNEELLRSEERFLRHIGKDRDVEGVILWYLGADRNLKALQTLRQAQVPVVFLDRRPPAGFDADYVGVDNVRAAEHVVNHLIRGGHRRIAHVTNLDTASTTAERLLGYQRALDKAQIPYDVALVRPDEGDHLDSPDPCGALVTELLSMPDPPTAVFAVNDLVAVHVVTSLRSRGIRVPEDMSVAGFDGTDRWSPGKPFLTSIRQPFERMGAEAVDLLLERIDKGATGAYKHVMLDAPLYVGGSTSARETARR